MGARQRWSRRLAAPLGLMLGLCGGQVAAAPGLPLPVPVAIPARPLPPLGAVATMTIPAVDAAGVRQTVNTRLTPAQTVWNLRSALNVAALNCLAPKYQPILDAYKLLLKGRARELARASRAVDGEFRARHGAGFMAARDAYMTQVYNYFALAPTRPTFCDMALTVSNDLAATNPPELAPFASQALGQLDTVFEGFFRSFEAYQVAAADWDARYGRTPPLIATSYAAPGTMGRPAVSGAYGPSKEGGR